MLGKEIEFEFMYMKVYSNIEFRNIFYEIDLTTNIFKEVKKYKYEKGNRENKEIIQNDEHRNQKSFI